MQVMQAFHVDDETASVLFGSLDKMRLQAALDAILVRNDSRCNWRQSAQSSLSGTRARTIDTKIVPRLVNFWCANFAVYVLVQK